MHCVLAARACLPAIAPGARRCGDEAARASEIAGWVVTSLLVARHWQPGVRFRTLMLPRFVVVTRRQLRLLTAFVGQRLLLCNCLV